MPEYGVEGDTPESVKKEWRDASIDQYTNHIKLKPFAKEFLEFLKTNGIIGHHLDNGVVTKKATYDEEGEIVYTCSICGAQIHEVIPKLSY